MVPTVIVALALAAGPAAKAVKAPAAKAPAPPVKVVDSVADAIKDILARKPRVIAFGEVHQTTRTVAVESSVQRFTNQILPVLARASSDLVVETWITDGECGEKEKAAVKEIEKTTERPPQTENEVVTLIRRAKELGAEPHILKLTCQDYDAVHPDGGVDYDVQLRMTSSKLEGQIDAALGRKGGDPARAVAVYGGALHNDLYPTPEEAPWTFGRSVSAKVGGRYVEVDLYVPEYIEGIERLTAQPWYAAYRRAAQPGKAAVVQRGEGSFIVVYPRGAPASPALPAAPDGREARKSSPR